MGKLYPVEQGLKPCPFCGGEASGDGHIRYSRPLTDSWWADGTPIAEAFFVNCIKCGACCRSGVSGGYQTKAEAIAAWNTRATPTLDQKGVARALRPYIGAHMLSDAITDILALNPVKQSLTTEVAERVREACAKVVEDGQETWSNAGGDNATFLTKRKHGNQSGLAYASAIRSLDITGLVEGDGHG